VLRDADTVIQVPHAVTRTRARNKSETRIDDPRTSVTMRDRGLEIVLFFEGGDLSGDAPLLEVRILPDSGRAFEPWRLAPRLPLYLSYARAAMAGRANDARAALRALRAMGVGRRGLPDDFFAAVAEQYNALVADGELYPITALAEMQPVAVSTASRWVKEARRRGLVKDGSDG
jgi:hypothetical protein